jgi:hypothetical protein
MSPPHEIAACAADPAAEVDTALSVIHAIGGSPAAASFTLLDPPNKTQPLRSKARCRLMRHLDSAAAAAPQPMDDFKITLTRAELTAVVGAQAVARLYAQFKSMGGHVCEIKLRRCAAYGQCINFHLDHAKMTMQVALNGDDEYCGGRLVFAGQDGFRFPARPAGAITIHDSTVVHGVTKMQSGVRYGLFFLRK